MKCIRLVVKTANLVGSLKRYILLHFHSFFFNLCCNVLTKPGLKSSRAIFWKFCLGVSENACEFPIFSEILKIFPKKKRWKLHLNLFWVVFRVKYVYLNKVNQIDMLQKHFRSTSVLLISKPLNFIINFSLPKNHLFFEKIQKSKKILLVKTLGEKFSTKLVNKKVGLGTFRYRHPLP